MSLMKRIYLIDCPGIVPPSKDELEENIVLRGVVRLENLKYPEEFIPHVLERVKKQYIEKMYGLTFESHEDFLEKLGKKSGRLGKGGEVDLRSTARIVLTDYVRGKLPYYFAPPDEREQGEEAEETEHQVSIKPQKFKSIMVTAEFEKDELRGDGEDVNEDEEAVSSDEEEDGDLSGEEESEAENQLPVSDAKEKRDIQDLAWEEAFNEPPSSIQLASSPGAVSSPAENKRAATVESPVKPKKQRRSDWKEEAIEEKEEEEKPKKGKRMTTNKKKVGVHYYEGANVKNKNRNKQKK